MGSARCRDAFGQAYDRCADAVTVALAWAVCWPMKLSFVCNLVQAVGGQSVCEPDGKIDVGVGQGYASLKDTRDKLSDSLGDAEIEFNMDTKPVVVGVSDAARAAKGVMRDFETRRRFLDAVVTLVKRCLSLVFLKIVYNASTYHHKYMSSIEHDNVYITGYFRKIDARRKARGSVTLLPLKKLERSKLVDPWEWRRNKAESRHLLGQTAKLILEIITASIFVLLDQLLIEVLDIVRRNARLEITQVGHHDMSVTVVGRGLLASLVRSLAHSLNTKRRISQLVTNEACLPRPNLTPSSILISIYGTYFLIWLMLLLDGYSQRMRRCCSAFFHRKREKRRILYLYNETLRRRIGFLRFARARVANSTRARQLDQNASLFEILSSSDGDKKMPEWFMKSMKWFEFARRKCAVCDEIEPRKGKKNLETEEYQVCPQCGLVYCPECWRDVGKECLEPYAKKPSNVEMAVFDFGK
ncbi:hypothetical protein QAD02_005265 [Eretmocerus hayati]|uniref:Uncharacterized protein n=1 Tax=Eretmocerus hayati TaxID=131215 RepID=A0ACC2NS26_9HYME|nr:hypothetical protein QAD02_005265 [Eretmocerus hayati]